MLMYVDDNDGYFPASVPSTPTNSGSFAPLIGENYIAEGKIFTCPSRQNTPATSSQSHYSYLASGLRIENPVTDAGNSVARDIPRNHDARWKNTLYADAHVDGEASAR